MTAAFVTLVFLATLWMLIVVGAAVLEQSGVEDPCRLRAKDGVAVPLARCGCGSSVSARSPGSR